MKRSLLRLAALAALVAMGAGCAGDRRPDYTEPLTSPGGKFTKLPPAVQNTVRAEAGAAEIDDIVKNTNSEPVVYEFHFVDSDVFPPLFVSPDGSVLTSNRDIAVGASEDSIVAATGGALSGLKLGDLPPEVVQTIHVKAPTAEVDHITKVNHGPNIFYEVRFKEETKYPKLLITEKGALVQALPD